MAVLFGVLSAVFSGAGDFFGGLASKTGRPLAVGIANHATGVIVGVPIAMVLVGSPIATDLWWGAAAGLSGGLAILALYRGFAVSDIAVVSPIAAVGAAGWPVLFSLVTGDRPSAAQAAGLGLGLAAIWTVGGSSVGGRRRRATAAGVGFGMGAGLGFGGLLIFLSFVGEDAGVWPLVPARLAGGGLLLVIGLLTSADLVPHRPSRIPAAAAGALTFIGNGSFVLAVNRGSLAVVSVLAAMFPAMTVLLAHFVLGEVLGKRRLTGLAMALVAVGLVAIG